MRRCDAALRCQRGPQALSYVRPDPRPGERTWSVAEQKKHRLQIEFCLV
ncbi:MAG TPA: hypothetical protein VKI64_08040 [Acidimicrobiales bacterium]|nr:hypothetical protein [Acidimicrobiales bacterium]